MKFKFSKRSLKELEGIHPDLLRVTCRALELTPIDFIITDGLRTIEEQRAYVARGASKTMKSRHLSGKAVDFVAYKNGKATYDVKLMTQIADAFKKAANELGVLIEWGGDWKTFKDTPHIELDRRKYK